MSSNEHNGLSNQNLEGTLEITGEARTRVVKDRLRVVVSLNFDTSDINEGIANVNVIYNAIKAKITDLDQNCKVAILNTMIKKSSDEKLSLFKSNNNVYVFSSISITCTVNGSVIPEIVKICDVRKSERTKVEFVFNIRSWFELSSEEYKRNSNILFSKAIQDSYERALLAVSAINDMCCRKLGSVQLNTVKSLVVSEIKNNEPFMVYSEKSKLAMNSASLARDDIDNNIGNTPSDVEITSSVLVKYTLIY